MNTQELMELADLYAIAKYRFAHVPSKPLEARAALEAAIQALQAEVQQWKSEAMTGSNAQMLRDQNKALQAEVDALKADTDRLDWLEASDGSHGFCHTMYGEYRFYAHQLPNYPTVRQVIDAAKGNA